MKEHDDFAAFIALAERMAKQPKLFNEFCHLIFTAQEREQLGTRIRIIDELLEQRLSQRDIAARFGLSISKITRGSNQLKQHDKSFLDKIQRALHTGPLYSEKKDKELL